MTTSCHSAAVKKAQFPKEGCTEHTEVTLGIHFLSLTELPEKNSNFAPWTNISLGYQQHRKTIWIVPVAQKKLCMPKEKQTQFSYLFAAP